MNARTTACPVLSLCHDASDRCHDTIMAQGELKGLRVVLYANKPYLNIVHINNIR